MTWQNLAGLSPARLVGWITSDSSKHD
jgi:hypothetical protein